MADKLNFNVPWAILGLIGGFVGGTLFAGIGIATESINWAAIGTFGGMLLGGFKDKLDLGF